LVKVRSPFLFKIARFEGRSTEAVELEVNTAKAL